MTIRELYGLIGGDYDQAVKVMKMDKLIDKYVRKLENSGTDKMLAEALEAMDAKMLFESAHGMKGVCGNLGLTALAADTEIITEEFRPGNSRTMTDEEVRNKVAEILNSYEKTVEGIRRYTEEA